MVLGMRGFPLHKLSSNSHEFLVKISENSTTSSIKIDKQSDSQSVKVLSLRWVSSDDTFLIDVNTSQNPIFTKRQILSESSKIFDPLGLIAPITVTFKIILQQLWLENYSWDEQVREPLAAQWRSIHEDLQYLTHLRIPRWLETFAENYELHGFSDASELAYAAAIYCRSANSTGKVTTTLLTAKTKVAPVKQISIPRLELSGALLLARLLSAVKTALNKPNINCFAWTDLKIVLSWLSAHSRTWKTYIANRTLEILTILPRHSWHHVFSQDNPADVASRGMSPKHLLTSRLWWNGPVFLSSNWKAYTHDEDLVVDESLTTLERKQQTLLSLQVTFDNQTLTTLFSRFSSLMKILRILARCIQFSSRCRQLKFSDDGIWITTDQLEAAQQCCIRWTQSCNFYEEINTLQKGKPISSSSPLLPLSPILDENNILRVGGRLDRTSCSFDTKHPIILPKDHVFVKLLISYLHAKYLHAGTNTLLCIIRQRYWIISCRTLIKKHITSCIRCVRHRAQLSQQLMASLPHSRRSFAKPFENVGIDYAGPLSLLLHRGRGARCCKGYIAVFICLNTRALHLEAASDLSSEAFIACFKRFISRRGSPSNVYSDNGTNFVGANRKICELYKLVSSTYHNNLIAEFSVSNGIKWHFSPPSAPHFGGSWESGVKLVKTHIRRTIGDTKLTFEELSTVLAQIEAVVNSRPLTPVSDDVDSFDVLTPGHFLIGKPLVALPEPFAETSSTSLITRWRLTQKMYNNFWNRWHKEYLVTLQNRPKWRKENININIGDLVLIKEDNMPPATWALGRVTKVHPG